MTTGTTAIQASKQRIRALIGATTVTVALLGGTAFWQLWPSGEAASPRTTSATAGTIETVGLTGGLAELYAERERETRASKALLERMGGMAELYRDQAATLRSAR